MSYGLIVYFHRTDDSAKACIGGCHYCASGLDDGHIASTTMFSASGRTRNICPVTARSWIFIMEIAIASDVASCLELACITVVIIDRQCLFHGL